MKFFQHFSVSKLGFLFLFVSLATGSVMAQQDYSTEGISSVFYAANKMLEAGDYSGAIPPLQEVIYRTKDQTDASGMEMLQGCRYQLGLSLFQVGKVNAGMVVLGDYLENEPRTDEAMALRMMAQGHLDSQDWPAVVTVVNRLLEQPQLSEEDLLNANLLLGQALFKQEQWADCIKPLTYVSGKSKEEHIRRVTGIMVVRAMVDTGAWTELFSWIPRLYSTDAKYDITLNLTLMNAGRAQFEKASVEEAAEDITASYLRALLLYRMVLPREELIQFSEVPLRGLKKKLAVAEASGAGESVIEQLASRVDDLENSLQVLRDLPAYESEVAFRVGQIYTDVHRFWEGFVIFDKLYREDATSQIGEASLLQSVMILYDLNKNQRAESRIIQYITENPGGAYTRMLLSMLIRDHLSKKNYVKVASMLDFLQGLPAPTTAEDNNLVADINYMAAFGFFQNEEYVRAADLFTLVYDDYKGSHFSANSIYFRGLCFLMRGMYEPALSDFVEYQANNARDTHTAVCMFREAVCLYALDRSEEAEKVFGRFLKKYPTDTLVSEAFSMRGDIEASKEASSDDPYTLDRALRDYRLGLEKATDGLQASYPVFQSAKVFKLESKWQEIIDLMTYYMESWHEKANVAEAVYWIGFAQIEVGEVSEAIAAYLTAIDQFGNDPTKLGVDKIIAELIKISQYHLSEEDRAGIAVRLKLKQTMLDPDDEAVLHLRLRVLQAFLQGEEASMLLGTDLLESKTDLAITTPVSLGLMCDAAVEMGDSHEMKRLSKYFIKKYEGSDLLWHAYRAKASKRLDEGKLRDALVAVEEAQSLFGAETFMGWAQLMKAQTLFKLKEYAAAEKEYNMVMGVSEWRGPIFAEAMYGMGICRMALRDFDKAHAFFQRTYLLFKSYDNGDWAAKGYLAAARCAKKLGNDEGAISTLEEMLVDDYTKDNPLTESARKLLSKWEEVQ